MLAHLKRQAWMQPLMPHLRKIRRNFDTLRELPKTLPEERASKAWLARNCKQAKEIEDAFIQVRHQGGYFSGWALSRSALRSFCGCLLSSQQNPSIVEFGSGQSTLFWAFLLRSLPLRLNSFEHHPDWYEQLNRRIKGTPGLTYHLRPLKQLNRSEKELLWQTPASAHQLFLESGVPVPAAQNAETRLIDCFYDLDTATHFEADSIDGMILDGPNGSGRSISFPLLFPFLKPTAWILIDDFDHYPFLAELSQLFAYDVLHEHLGKGNRWSLLRLKGRLTAFGTSRDSTAS
ncbi:MAG: hypothetical protein CVV27_10390 [Candidatus Melainabacteria bacterium HGW-Melainabacteria-1]|nr:MAG: hypothetical protein CVV27_10390 [Candidatus Melainabacteria bacterium HGW-Melainabacteria-1]